MTDSAIDLRVPDIATLHQRRSEKWSNHEADVLASTVAEMDFPLAPDVSAALHAAIDRHDLGYTPPAATELPAAFAGFARRRLGWMVDQDQITLAPDVMAGLIELCRALVVPGEPVAYFTPAYPPFFAELPQAQVDCTLADANISSNSASNLDTYNSGADVRFKLGTLTKTTQE